MLATNRHAQMVLAALDSGEATRSSLVASWHRCVHRYGLDPKDRPPRLVLTAAEFEAVSERAGRLLCSARPTFERLQRSLGVRGVCVLFATDDGVTVYSHGAPGDQNELRQRGLWQGIDWSEKSGGTNGIGTCLVERIPLAVHADEHFFARDADITCLAAPVFDHVGAMAGALSVAVPERTMLSIWQNVMLAVVTEAARQIEVDHFHNFFRCARIICVPSAPRCGTALLAVDADDVVIGATQSARRTLQLTDARLRAGVCARDLFVGEYDGLPNAERSAIWRALVRSNGNVSAGAKMLGISRATMKRRLSHYGLTRKR